MIYEGDQGGRVIGDGSGHGSVWSFEAVQAELVDARRLWRRAPGGGRSPFATDGPWDMIIKESRAGDYDEQHGNEDAEQRSLPLSRAEVRRMVQISEWLLHAPERDRRLVVIVLGELARGAKRISWKKVRERLGVEIGTRGLGQRYSRAITAIAQVLTRRRVPVPAEIAGGDDGFVEVLSKPLQRPGGEYGNGEFVAAVDAWRRHLRRQR